VSVATTNGIRVEVVSAYLPERSSPRQRQFLFAYHVTIANVGDEVAQLQSRRWVVTDGNLRELRGVTPRAIWSTGKAFVEGVARDAHACVFAPGYEGGHACGTLAMDAATALVPGGVAMKGTRVARVAGEAGAVDTAGGLSSATSGSLSGSIGRFQSRRTIRSGGEAYRARVSEIAATKYADLPPDVAAIVAEHEMLSVELGVETFQWARPLDADAILRLESETLAMRRHHNNLNGYAAHIDDELSLAILRADLSRNAAFELEAASVPSTARAATAGSRRARNYGETRTSTYPRAMRSRLSRAEPVPVPRVLSGTERDLLEGMLATPGTDVAAAQEIAQRIALVPGSYRLSSQGVRILLDETDQMSVFYHGTTRTLAIHPSFFPAWYDGMVASGAKKLADEQLRDWVRSIVHDTSPR